MARGRQAQTANFDVLSNDAAVKAAIANGSLAVIEKTLTHEDSGKSVTYKTFSVENMAGAVALAEAQTTYFNSLPDQKEKATSEDTLADMVENFFTGRAKQSANAKLQILVAGPDKQVEKVVENLRKASAAMGVPFDEAAVKTMIRAQLGLAPATA